MIYNNIYNINKKLNKENYVSIQILLLIMILYKYIYFNSTCQLLRTIANIGY